MAVELVRSNRLFSGIPYADAATAPEIGLIVTAGACPLDGQGRVVGPGDIAAQMRQALDNLRIALEESGAAMRDVLKTTIFVSTSSRDDLVVAWNEVAGGFGDHNPPSTSVGTAADYGTSQPVVDSSDESSCDTPHSTHQLEYSWENA